VPTCSFCLGIEILIFLWIKGNHSPRFAISIEFGEGSSTARGESRSGRKASLRGWVVSDESTNLSEIEELA
jgi:hypothetical protein